MTNLSPQAQAIINAAYALPLINGQPNLAAALRVLVEQLMYMDDDGDLCINPEYILDIAEELAQGLP